MDLTTTQLIDIIKETLSNKVAKNGLHVGAITLNVMNMTRNIFDEPANKEVLKVRINRVLNRESKRENGLFARVKNPKTNKFRRGVYALNNKR